MSDRKSALHPNKIHKGSRWCHDIDYVHKLNEHEKAWLAQYLDEVLNTQFEPEGNFYNTQTEKRILWNEANARRRDVMSVLKYTGKIPHPSTGINSTEDAMNETLEKPLRDRLASVAFQVVLDDHGFSLKVFPIKAAQTRKNEKQVIKPTNDVNLCRQMHDIVWKLLRKTL